MPQLTLKLPAVILIATCIQIANSYAACIEGEKEMNELMDMSANVCENFFDYACGNWQPSYTLHAFKAHDVFTAASAVNKHKLLKYFEELHVDEEHRNKMNNENENMAVRKFYTSCVEEFSHFTERTEQRNTLANYLEMLQGLNATRNLPQCLSEDFSRINGNPRQVNQIYNIINNNYKKPNDNHNVNNWWRVAAELRRMGVQSFWQLLVSADWQSADQQILYLTPVTFGYMKHAGTKISKEDILMQQRYLKNLLIDLGLRLRAAVRLSEQLTNFELSLIKLQDNEQTVILHAPQTLAYWSSQVPDLHLSEYFEILFVNMPALHDLEKILLVADIKYLQKLQKFLNSMPNAILEKFMLLKYLTHFEVHHPMDDCLIQHQLYCLQQVQTFMPLSLTQLLLQLQINNNKLNLKQVEEDLNALFEELKQQFEAMLNATKIFEHDAISKVLGIEKLRAMRLILPQIENATENENRNYNFTKAYSTNLMQLWQQRTQLELEQLLTPIVIDLHSNIYTPFAVNALYRLQENAIELPVALMGPPFYSNNTTPPQLYGRLVFLMAHELLHAFDFDGLNYDKSGNVSPGWGPKSIIEFSDKAECYMEERYANTTLNVNENIADTEGLRLAFESLRAFFEKNSVNEIIDLYYESLKSFFISFAQTWCTSEQKPALYFKNSNRVNNVLGNFPEFATLYNCDEDSALNPEEKCRIW